jgi:hypothetical protein
MKKYYLNNGQENIGPFDKEELREQKINKDSLVWADDWIEWKNMGAYTIAGACNFNGIALTQPKKLYVY